MEKPNNSMQDLVCATPTVRQQIQDMPPLGEMPKVPMVSQNTIEVGPSQTTTKYEEDMIVGLKQPKQ